MPRKSQTRNPFGTILEQTVTVAGRRRTVFSVRKRYPVTDASGERILDASGKPKYKDVTRRCYSKAEALIALRNIDSQVGEKKKRDEEAARRPKQTFQDLAEYYLKTYCKPAVVARGRVVSGLRQNTKVTRTVVESQIAFFGAFVLAEITYEDIRAYAEHVATTPIKDGEQLPKVSTVNRKLALLRRILNIGVRLRWIRHNPFSEGDPLIRASEENARTRVLSFEEERLMLATCDLEKIVTTTTRKGKPFSMTFVNPYRHLKPILIMAIDTGLRSGEIFKLTWQMVDFDGGVINLPDHLTKAWKARIVPLSSRLADELAALKVTPAAGRSPFVFGGLKSVRKAFEGLVRHCKLEDLHFHDLRHTATTWMDDAGVSSAAKMNIVGHTSEAVHQRYNNPSADVMKSVRAAIDAHVEKRAGA